MPTVAETLIDGLYDLGVRQVWGVVGDALNPVTDAIRRDDRLDVDRGAPRRGRGLRGRPPRPS